MPVYKWICPECRYEWEANVQLKCGNCLMEKVKMVDGVRADPPKPKYEPCGYCSGRGWVYGRRHDNHGYQRHESPPQVSCEYCGGSGACDHGQKLLPATPPRAVE